MRSLIAAPGRTGAMPTHGLRLALRVGAALAATIAVAACHPRVDTHGFMPNPDLIAQIEPGQQSKSDVAGVLGTPSTVATFDQDTWYYITQKSRTFAFFKPEIVDQEVLVINFDGAEVVSDINRYTIEDGLIIDPVTRKTPTAGKELSFLQQLFGNIGRFSQ